MTEAAPANGEIFIVDDDPAFRQMLSIVFSQAGFHATCFADGAALLASGSFGYCAMKLRKAFSASA